MDPSLAGWPSRLKRRVGPEALGYASVVLLIILFFACLLLTFAGGEVLKAVMSAQDDPERSIQDIVGRGWFWLYLGAVFAFLKLWPWS